MKNLDPKLCDCQLNGWKLDDWTFSGHHPLCAVPKLAEYHELMHPKPKPKEGDMDHMDHQLDDAKPIVLRVKVTPPKGATEEEIQEYVAGLSKHLDAAHKSLGGSGLKVYKEPQDPGCKLPSTEIGTNLGDMLKKALEQPEAQGGR